MGCARPTVYGPVHIHVISACIELNGYAAWGRHCTHRMPKTVSSEEGDRLCPVCMDEWRGKVTFECGHSMCTVCFAEHSKRSSICHMCRRPVPTATDRPRGLPSRDEVEGACMAHVRNSTEHMMEFIEFMCLIEDPRRQAMRVKGLFDSQYRLGIVAGLRMAYQRE